MCRWSDFELVHNTDKDKIETSGLFEPVKKMIWETHSQEKANVLF